MLKVSRVPGLVLALLVCCAHQVRAEGFALNEGSARGVSLAGGLVGRADDVSALAYNAAGITRLPGARLMGGLAFIAPLGSVEGETRRSGHATTPKAWVWPVLRMPPCNCRIPWP